MKKYVFVGIAILIIILVYNLLSLYTGAYINLNFNNDFDYYVYVDKENIYLSTGVKSGELIIKGVELNSFYPGYEFSDYNIDKKTYLKWINQINDMGANTIKVANRLDPDFYSALYEYNTTHQNEPMYIFQGIEITDYEANNSESIYGFKNNLINECKIAVDVIHGNKYIVTSKIYASGLYNKDVSPWTLGYIISSIGKEETISYTDNTDIRYLNDGYDGKFFYTESIASETECILAEVFDKLVSYETDKYREQRLVSLMVSMLQDPFEYRENVNVQIGKMCYIDLNNIKCKETLKTGKIVSYDLNTHIDEFIELLTEAEKEQYKDFIEKVDVTTYYNGFIDFINMYYDSPVLIAKYGFSTSRIKDKEEAVLLTEIEQGEKIVDAYNEFINLGTCGAVISTWQDNWTLESWNTLHSADEENEIYWLDNQSLNQKYGILSFESDDKSNCFVDGDLKEWEENNFITEKNGMKLYSKYDFENLYIMVDNISGDSEIYIPIDTTQNSGASQYGESGETEFNRLADFVIKINGRVSGEIFVQKYYDSIRAMYENNITGELQYSNVPDKNTSEFVSMRALLKKSIDPVIDISQMTAEQRKQYRMYKFYDTGELIHGNSNPESSEFNSLADYYFSGESLEIKIPWSLLNFYAPNKMMIHDDYYKNYGVDGIKIQEMYLGVGNENDIIELDKLDLISWNEKVTVEERLKKSYYIIKDCWNEE